MTRRAALGALAALMVPTHVGAEVLIHGNVAQLCVVGDGDRSYVDPDRLALLIVSEARAMPYLDGANATGDVDGALKLVSDPSSLSEPVYAILNSGKVFPAAANRPFGPKLDLTSSPDALSAHNRIVKAAGDELGMLIEHGQITELGKTMFRVAQVGALASTDADPRSFFGPERTRRIECLVKAPTPKIAPPDVVPRASPPSPIVAAVRLRGTAKDIASSAPLKDVEPATVSYERDEAGGKTSFGIVAVAGLSLTSISGSLGLAPYVAYEHTAITGGKGNIEKVSPGLLGSFRLERPNYAVHTTLELSYIDDIAEKSRQGKLRLYVEPVFRNFGLGYYSAVGPLEVRPVATGIIDASKIYSIGTNAALMGASSYLGIGGQLDIKAYLNVQNWLKNLKFGLGGRQLFIASGLTRHSVNRWSGSLDYADDVFPYFGVGFSFTKGDNDDTFQKEEIYKVGLKLRY